MNNPYKSGDSVLIKIKGQQVEATVNQVWNEEVQVRTADKKLIWRTVKTVEPVQTAMASTDKVQAEKIPASAEASTSDEREKEEPPPLSTASAPESPDTPPKGESDPIQSTSVSYKRKRFRHGKRPKI